MSDPNPETTFPPRGDNFVTVGPWRILSGETWRSWQLEAETAHVEAAVANGDEFGARRTRLRRDRLKTDGVARFNRSG